MRLCCVLLILGAGCAPMRETEKNNERSTYVEELRRYEADFRPSDYDIEPDTTGQENTEAVTPASDSATVLVAHEKPELMSGFRVQLFSSTNIDETNARKAEAEEYFPDQWFYVVYDPPAYKLRGGNFVSRFEADKFAKQLLQRGYRDAWIVPERILKNPPPRPLGTPVPGKEGK